MSVNVWWVILAIILGPSLIGAIFYNIRISVAKRLEPAMDHGRKDGMISGALGIEPTPKYRGRQLAAYREGLAQGRFMVRDGSSLHELRDTIRSAGSIEALQREGYDVSSFKR